MSAVARTLRLSGIVGYAAPPPGYPFPVPYPMYPSSPPKTMEGVRYARWALVLAIAMQAIAVAQFAWEAVVLSLAASGGPATTFELFIATSAFVCATAIVGLAALIFFLLAVYTTHDGPEEYGPDHALVIDRAVIYFIIAFVMGAIASVGGLGSGTFGGSPVGFLFPFSPIGGAFGAVRGLFVGLVLASLVTVFTSKEERDQARIATALLTISPAIAAGIAVLIALVSPAVDPFTLTVPAFAPPAFAAAAVLAGVELVAYVLFLRIYSNVHRRMRAGELPPIPRPPPMYTPYYPGYYPPYPVVQEAPPPTAPPPGQPPP